MGRFISFDHEVKINIEFNPLSSLLIQTAGSGGGPVTVAGGSMGYSSLYVDYVYLDTDERRRFAQVSHEYLIEQLQFTGGESVSGMSNKIRLNFNHPVKELLWVVATDANVAANKLSTYTVTDVNGREVNPIVDAKLQLNGHDRFSTRGGSYFNLVQPYQHHSNIPRSRGINVYSFGLKPEEHQPSGTCNFSRIDNATLNLTMVPNLGSATVNIYAVNYNVLRIMSGMGKKIQTAHNSQLLHRIRSPPMQMNSETDRLSVMIICNWLVIRLLIATISNCWKLLTASISTSTSKDLAGTQINSQGRNNIEDWTISSQASKPKFATGMKKVQRLDDIGLSFKFDLRYSPFLNENSYDCGSGLLKLDVSLRHLYQSKTSWKHFYDILSFCKHTHSS